MSRHQAGEQPTYRQVRSWPTDVWDGWPERVANMWRQSPDVRALLLATRYGGLVWALDRMSGDVDEETALVPATPPAEDGAELVPGKCTDYPGPCVAPGICNGGGLCDEARRAAQHQPESPAQASPTEAGAAGECVCIPVECRWPSCPHPDCRSGKAMGSVGVCLVAGPPRGHPQERLPAAAPAVDQPARDEATLNLAELAESKRLHHGYGGMDDHCLRPEEVEAIQAETPRILAETAERMYRAEAERDQARAVLRALDIEIGALKSLVPLISDTDERLALESTVRRIGEVRHGRPSAVGPT